MNASRILIATPLDGNQHTAYVSAGYHHAVRQLERAGAVTIPSTLCFQDDLARARSRCVWYALQRGGFDYLLFWDDDVVPSDMTIVPRMIARAEADGHEVIGAPYPRKRILATFPYKPLAAQLEAGRIAVKNDCIEVEFMGIGFCLISASCLEKMVAHYADEWWLDSHDGADLHETIALFKQVHTDEILIPDGKGGTLRHRDLLSEDYSFMHRWRAMGGKVHMYVGEGAPLGHVGGHVFTGGRDELGRVR